MLKILLIGFAVAALLTTGGFTYAATQEQQDSFCASCHTQPESAFYQRSLDGQAVDLATAHKLKNTRCIDCHSGSGTIGRVSAELLGAHNALAFYTGTAIQPAILTNSISEDHCLKCHADINAQLNMNNHFHVFLARWQAADPNAATCVSCHSGHATDGDPQIGFLNRQATEKVCQACHVVLRGGD